LRVTIDQQWLIVGEILPLVKTDFDFTGKRVGELLVYLLESWRFAVVSTCLLVVFKIDFNFVLLKVKSNALLSSIY
jgi:hypothetical protein